MFIYKSVMTYILGFHRKISGDTTTVATSYPGLEGQ